MPSKPVDRLPIICAAGKNSERCESVANLLKFYSQEDLAQKLVQDNVRQTKLAARVPATPVIPENQLKDIMAPDLNKSRFLQFRDTFYENLYCKKVALGQPTPANSKPDYITNENFTFGIVGIKAESAGELTLPKKSTDEVLREYVKWHDKYRLSHGNYFPSERINRGYNDKFNPKRTYGRSSNVNVSGVLVKGILQDLQRTSKMHIISKAQEEYREHHMALLGKPLRRQKISPDPNTVFGRAPIDDEFHVKELLNTTVTPAEIKNYSDITTYRAFASDNKNSPIECRGPAGKLESQYPRKGNCKFLAENLGEETSAKQLISPSIPTHFGLSHRDFLVPRPKDQIRRIFTKAGYDLSDDDFFEKIWAMALREWTSLGDQVSVEAFKYILHKIASESK